MDFADHFSSLARQYATYRPVYPDELFAWLVTVVPARNLAWDCACGNGQASQGLARYFDKIVATDASAAQLAEAKPNPKIEYRVAMADHSGLPERSVDLVTCAQAAHWLDLDAFYREVRRVVRPRGVLALWTYEFFTIGNKAIMASVKNFYENTVGPYWPPERAYVRSGYRTLPFSFAETVEAPPFHMTVSWTLAQLIGYFRSWSAVKRYREAKGADPVIDMEKELAPLWGDPDQAIDIEFPVHMRVARL